MQSNYLEMPVNTELIQLTQPETCCQPSRLKVTASGWHPICALQMLINLMCLLGPCSLQRCSLRESVVGLHLP